MSAEYSLIYKDPITGVNAPMDFSTLDYTRKINEVGVMTVVPLTWELGDFLPDGQIYINRSVNGLPGDLEGETFWFVRKIKYTTDSEGKDTLELTAYDAMDLLRRRIVAYLGGTTYTQKTGIADDIMKDIVRENYGTTAFEAARNLSSKLAIQANASIGAAITAEIQNNTVIDALKKISDNSRELGLWILFDIVSTGEDALEFRTYLNYRGYDHSSLSALPVIVGPDFGSLTDIEFSYDYSAEANAVYAGGAGSDTAKDVELVIDATRMATSQYNRCELYYNCNKAVTVTQIQNEGKTALSANRPKLLFTGRMLEAAGSVYGIDFNFGDLITAQYKGLSLNCRLDTIHVTFSQDQGEVLDLRLRGEGYL